MAHNRANILSYNYPCCFMLKPLGLCFRERQMNFRREAKAVVHWPLIMMKIHREVTMTFEKTLCDYENGEMTIFHEEMNLTNHRAVLDDATEVDQIKSASLTRLLLV